MILRTIFSETLLTLRYGLTFQHLHGAEIGLAEGLEIDVISEQRLDVQVLEIGLLGVEERHRGAFAFTAGVASDSVFLSSELTPFPALPLFSDFIVGTMAKSRQKPLIILL